MNYLFDFAKIDAEMRLLIGGTEHDLWGHQNNSASTPNGAGFLIFERMVMMSKDKSVRLVKMKLMMLLPRLSF